MDFLATMKLNREQRYAVTVGSLLGDEQVFHCGECRRSARYIG
jgi:hypothetical protein